MLTALAQFEAPAEALKREVVLGKLNDLFKQFVKSVSLKKGMPESIAAEAGGKIFTFGSYRLGVHGSGTLPLERVRIQLTLFSLLD